MNKTLTAAAVLVFAASSAFAAQTQAQMGQQAVKKANKAVAADRAAMSTSGVQTTTTDVYDVSNTNKKGTTNYGVVQETTRGPLGNADSGAIVYSSYMPSKAAMSNERKGEWSLAVGQSYSTNEDTFGKRYATNGKAAGANILWDVTPHFAWGVDYMYLNPKAKSHKQDGESVEYKDFIAHDISLMGRYTLNAWDNWRVYIPMGAGLMNARMKTTSPSDFRSSKDKWGAAVFAGLGLQYDITTDWFVGLEYRYVYSFISDKHLSDFGRDSNLQLHNAFLRFGMRF